MITRFSSGGATVTLTGDLERFVQASVKAAGGALVQKYLQAAEAVAARARAEWYQQANRRTGRSGAWDTRVTVSDTEVRVDVVTLDPRVDKRGRHASFFVRRPGPASLVPAEITKEEYSAAKAAKGVTGRMVFKAKTTRTAAWGAPVTAGRFYRLVANPKASDGKQLLQELIRKPFRKAIVELGPEIGRAIADRLRAAR